jgi:hypothetical protein
VRVLALDEDWAAFDEQTRTSLKDVTAEFAHVSEAIWKNRRSDYGKPFRYQMGPRLGELQSKLGLTNAPALVLLDSTVLLESPRAARNRWIWNLTIGWATVIYFSCERVIHRMAIVDGQTREILWFHWNMYDQVNGRDQSVMRNIMQNFLYDLPRGDGRKDRREE